MFSVLFEVLARPDQWEAYLAYAKMLRPELEQVDGFVDNIRYKSLTREGWILSLSNWRDEKSVVRWRTKMRHHEVQEKGRHEVLEDYHLRVGQITGDTQIPPGCELVEQRLDETEVGEGTAVLLIDTKRPAQWNETTRPAECAAWLGLRPFSGLLSWEIFEAVLTPNDLILMVLFNLPLTAQLFEDSATIRKGARTRRVRVIRDYRMHDRREAPQYFPEVH